MFERLFGGLPARSVQPAVVEAQAEFEPAPVRFRPRLISQFTQDHAQLRAAVRGLLDACRRRDEDAQIVGLRSVAAEFRRISLTKSVQLYPYLRWGLENDRVATIQFKAVHAEVQRASEQIDAILAEYLQGPWLSAVRRRLMADVIRLAHLLAQALRSEETSLFPLYLPPGQYRHVRHAHAH